jgi:hypothetical protein
MRGNIRNKDIKSVASVGHLFVIYRRCTVPEKKTMPGICRIFSLA